MTMASSTSCESLFQSEFVYGLRARITALFADHDYDARLRAWVCGDDDGQYDGNDAGARFALFLTAFDIPSRLALRGFIKGR